MKADPVPWTATEEELWYEVFFHCIYGGMRPDTARDRVAALSPHGRAFADAVHDRWRTEATALRDAAIKGSPLPPG
jgi:hypothetical protein